MESTVYTQPAEETETTPYQSPWYHIRYPILRGLGWVIFFRLFGFCGICQVQAWRWYRLGERKRGSGYLLGSAVLAIGVAVVVVFLQVSMALSSPDLARVSDALLWELLMTAVGTGGIAFLIGIPVSGIWQRMLDPKPERPS